MEKEEARAQFKDAAARYQSGDYVGALNLLDALLAESPGNPDLESARQRCLNALTGHGDTKPPPAKRTPRTKTKHPVLRLLILLSFGALLTGGAYVVLPAYLQQKEVRKVSSESWESQSARLIEEHEAARAAAAQAEAEERERLRYLPGYEHPREEWQATAVNGLPVWEPGIYRNVPCRTKPVFTFDAYIPLAYRERPRDTFPFLTICMPGTFPGFLRYTEWAEKTGVILIVMNQVCNDTYAQNFEVQDHVLESIFGTMRLDPWLGLATGVSGGARCSWDMIVRHPNCFSGVLMIAFSEGDLGDVPPHVAIAQLHGNHDFNAKHIRKSVQRLEKEGRAHLHLEFPGGHEGGPLELRIKALNWLISTLQSRPRQ